MQDREKERDRERERETERERQRERDGGLVMKTVFAHKYMGRVTIRSKLHVRVRVCVCAHALPFR
jgi:hypothetical protein